MSTDLYFKIVIAGDPGVGKSSLVSQYISKSFRSDYLSTIGMDYSTKLVKILGKDTILQIFDSSGREEFRSIFPSYFRNAVGVLLVYDISKYHSFEHIRNWYLDVAAHANSFAIFLLVGNKRDLIKEREVTVEVAQEFAESHHFLFTETSALLNDNIDDTFQKMAEAVYFRNLSGAYYIAEQNLKASKKLERNLRKQSRKKCCGSNGCFWKWPPW